MQLFSYHTHTDFSDGRNTLEEMLKKAESIGYKEIGISDHLIVHKNFKQSPSWPALSSSRASHIYRDNFAEAITAFNQHIDRVRKIAKDYRIKVSIGAEVDYYTYDGWEEEFIDFKQKVDLDYYISGNHFFITSDQLPVNPKNILDFSFDSSTIKEMIIRHLKTLAAAANSGYFEFLAHLDYVSKVELFNNPEFDSYKKDVVTACQKHNTAIEINTRHINAVNGDFLSRTWFEQIKKQNIPLVISDDAHRVEQLGYDFYKAEKMLSDLNLTNRWSFGNSSKS